MRYLLALLVITITSSASFAGMPDSGTNLPGKIDLMPYKEYLAIMLQNISNGHIGNMEVEFIGIQTVFIIISLMALAAVTNLLGLIFRLIFFILGTILKLIFSKLGFKIATTSVKPAETSTPDQQLNKWQFGRNKVKVTTFETSQNNSDKNGNL